MLNYQDELLRRILGVEEVEIPLPASVIPSPGRVIHTIHTNEPTRSLQFAVDTYRDHMVLMLRDEGRPLWIRSFNFVHPPDG